MKEMVERYEQTVQQLREALDENRTYEQRFQTYDVFEQIKREEEDIQQLLEEVKVRAIVLRQLRQKQTSFIGSHPHFPTIHMRELLPARQDYRAEAQGGFACQINHSIRVSLQIHSMHHFMQEWGNLANQLRFQTFRFHLHHVDKTDSSRLMRYHPQRNMYHVSHILDNKLIRCDRTVSLSVQHIIRTANLELYRELLNRQPICVVAESSYGAVVGTAEMEWGEMGSREQIKKRVCLKFCRKWRQEESIVEQRPVFYAVCDLSVSISPVAPQLEELTKNSQSQLKERAGSRSPSPGRVISSGGRQKSPKVKRELVRRMVRSGGSVELSMFEGWQYKYELERMNLSISKELIYRSLQNIKERRIELVKAGDNFYFKLFALKEDGAKSACIVFSFNSREYRLHVLPHTLFQLMPLALYQQSSKVERKDKGLLFKNSLIELGEGNQVYARESNRVQKNLAKLEVECKLLGTVFVRSILSQCSMHCSRPFQIVEAVKKQDGFMLTYYYQLDHPEPKERTLVVYLASQTASINEMHVYTCVVFPRKVTQQTIYRQIYLPEGQEFARLSLKMIASQSYRYQIQASEAEKVRVVNGCNFRYKNGSNENLILQVVGRELPLLTDLVFRDNKNRAFFMRLAVKGQV